MTNINSLQKQMAVGDRLSEFNQGPDAAISYEMKRFCKRNRARLSSANPVASAKMLAESKNDKKKSQRRALIKARKHATGIRITEQSKKKDRIDRLIG